MVREAVDGELRVLHRSAEGIRCDTGKAIYYEDCAFIGVAKFVRVEYTALEDVTVRLPYGSGDLCLMQSIGEMQCPLKELAVDSVSFLKSMLVFETAATLDDMKWRDLRYRVVLMSLLTLMFDHFQLKRLQCRSESADVQERVIRKERAELLATFRSDDLMLGKFAAVLDSIEAMKVDKRAQMVIRLAACMLVTPAHPPKKEFHFIANFRCMRDRLAVQEARRMYANVSAAHRRVKNDDSASKSKHRLRWQLAVRTQIKHNRHNRMMTAQNKIERRKREVARDRHDRRATGGKPKP
jgi:hypothetical protein